MVILAGIINITTFNFNLSGLYTTKLVRIGIFINAILMDAPILLDICRLTIKTF